MCVRIYVYVRVCIYVNVCMNVCVCVCGCQQAVCSRQVSTNQRLRLVCFVSAFSWTSLGFTCLLQTLPGFSLSVNSSSGMRGVDEWDSYCVMDLTQWKKNQCNLLGKKNKKNPNCWDKLCRSGKKINIKESYADVWNEVNISFHWVSPHTVFKKYVWASEEKPVSQQRPYDVSPLTIEPRNSHLMSFNGKSANKKLDLKWSCKHTAKRNQSPWFKICFPVVVFFFFAVAYDSN